ncbi:MAG: nucleotidyl transferase AbiEii/AbiGii toxin family protein [Thermoplasmata archaeon]
MMKKDEILKMAKISRMKPYQQEKHYIQTLVLRSIYSEFNPAFKGGTALMFFHGLNRFSEDLDFTFHEEFSGGALLKKIKSDLEYMDIKATYKTAYDNKASFAFKLGVEGPLFSREIERCFVDIEISRRETVEMPIRAIFLETPYQDILPFAVGMMDVEEIVAEKIRAIITRNKARDVYDLHFLLKRDVKISIYLANKKLKYYNKTFDEDAFKDGIRKKKGIWTAELTPIIFGQLPKFDEVENVIIEHFTKEIG